MSGAAGARPSTAGEHGRAAAAVSTPAAARRWPVVSTLVVVLAVAGMIALGLWQLLDRLPRKEAFLAQLQANPAKPAIAFPARPDEALLFRRAGATCTPPTRVRLEGAGAAGYRAIATCADGLTVQLGTTHDPKAEVAWPGGPVAGTIANAPGGQSLIGALLDPQPPKQMLVAATPPAGLSPNAPPKLASIPNSHLAYAGQWFFFAGIASVIYVLALRRRRG